MKRLVIAGLILGTLSGCATAGRVEFICLPMSSYSVADQSAAADELDGLPEGSVIGRMIVDYGVMRAANRACLGR